jgi:hypothetical protein
MDNLFVGNIMHRTRDNDVNYFGVRVTSERGTAICLVKLRAVLCQTEEGNFIDVDAEQKEIFPSIAQSSLSDIDRNDGYFGFFVDSEALVPYNAVEHYNIKTYDGRVEHLTSQHGKKIGRR